MDKDATIYIAGHRGLVGSALMRRLSHPSPSRRGAGGEGRVIVMVRKDLKAAERDELIKKQRYKAMDYHE